MAILASLLLIISSYANHPASGKIYKCASPNDPCLCQDGFVTIHENYFLPGRSYGRRIQDKLFKVLVNEFTLAFGKDVADKTSSLDGMISKFKDKPNKIDAIKNKSIKEFVNRSRVTKAIDNDLRVEVPQDLIPKTHKRCIPLDTWTKSIESSSGKNLLRPVPGKRTVFHRQNLIDFDRKYYTMDKHGIERSYLNYAPLIIRLIDRHFPLTSENPGVGKYKLGAGPKKLRSFFKDHPLRKRTTHGSDCSTASFSALTLFFDHVDPDLLPFNHASLKNKGKEKHSYDPYSKSYLDFVQVKSMTFLKSFFNEFYKITGDAKRGYTEKLISSVSADQAESSVNTSVGSNTSSKSRGKIEFYRNLVFSGNADRLPRRGDWLVLNWRGGGGHSVIADGLVYDKNDKVSGLCYFSSNGAPGNSNACVGYSYSCDPFTRIASFMRTSFVYAEKPSNIPKFRPIEALEEAPLKDPNINRASDI